MKAKSKPVRGLLLATSLLCCSYLHAYDLCVDGVYYDLNGTEATVTTDGVSYDRDSGSNTYTGEVVIPSSFEYFGTTYSVVAIGNYAFEDCCNLTAVTIGSSVAAIGRGAFAECRGLTSVVLPNAVTTIDNRAFDGCRNLTSLILGNSVTTIGGDAFQYCNLQSITIPPTVTSMEWDVFYGNENLDAVYISDLSAWSKIYFGNKYANPLYYAHHLYLNNQEITDLVIPEGITSLGEYAFTGCSNVISLTLPESLISIDKDAFSDCSNLNSVKCYATTPPALDDNAFADYSATLYVPAAAVDVYKSTDCWKEFLEIKALESAGIADIAFADDAQIAIDGNTLIVAGNGQCQVVELSGVVRYSGDANCELTLSPGIYVVLLNDKAHKITIK